MKKSPLSTPGGSGNFFHNRRGHNRGYGHNNKRSDNDNTHQFFGRNNSYSFGSESEMIPLGSSSPITPQKRKNWRYPNNKCNQYSNNKDFSRYNNHKNIFSNHAVTPYNVPTNQGYQNRQKNDPHWYRQLPILELIDMKSVFSDPWESFQNKNKSEMNVKTVVENSVEIIYENNKFQDSSMESQSDDNTINISSSYEEVKEGSSVELELENMTFNQDSKSSNNSIKLQEQKPINNLSESVIIIEK